MPVLTFLFTGRDDVTMNSVKNRSHAVMSFLADHSATCSSTIGYLLLITDIITADHTATCSTIGYLLLITDIITSVVSSLDRPAKSHTLGMRHAFEIYLTLSCL